MSKKKGKPALTRQQQQEAAARRRTATGPPATSRAAVPPLPTEPTAPSSPPVTTREPAVRHYLDISVVRIQEWLGRTPGLKYRRGGSVMLSLATGRTAWPDEALPAGTRWNDQAGDLDGVVSLVIDTEVPEPAVAGTLETSARQVATILREKLPFCHIQAVAGSGDSYATAFGQLEQARSNDAFLVDSPPPPAELILAKPCDQCRAAPAVHKEVRDAVVTTENPPDLCADCKRRVEAAGGTKGSREHRLPRPERRLRRALAKAGMTVADFPDNFHDLAEHGRRDLDDAPTQLGLIYADGNRVGAFLSAATDHARAHGTPAKSDIVTALDNAVLAALADAVMACFASTDRPPVLAHLAGGDDLLISVPAGDTWPFARTLLQAFGNQVSGALRWPTGIQLPSLSAGLVFHHLSAPFPDVVRLAHGQLRAAKAATHGKEASVAFLDLTADGDAPPASRTPLTADELTGQAARLTGIATASRSHRETLVALERLTQVDPRTMGPAGTGETPAEALARRTVDLGCTPIWDAVLNRERATAPEVRTALTADDPEARDQLRRALDLARYWPPANSAAPPEAGAARIRQEARA